MDFHSTFLIWREHVCLRRSEGARGERVSFLREPDDAPVVVVTLDLTAEVRVVDPAGERIEEAELRTRQSAIERLPSGDQAGWRSEREVDARFTGSPTGVPSATTESSQRSTLSRKER